MTSTDKVSFAGDVKVEDVTVITLQGTSQVITAQVVGIEIYEDLFSPFITGKIYVRDSQELTNLLPLVGEEIVKLKIRTPSLEDKDGYNQEYFINKIDDRFNTSERELVYVIHFISKEAIVDLNKQISKAYSGKISDIAKTLISDFYGLESTKPANIEETKNSTMFVSNFWSPAQCIQYICEQAINANNSPTYLFFENKYGLNFVSLETLYTGTPIKQRFVLDKYSRDISKQGTATSDITRDYQTIIEIATPQTFDYIDRLKSGFYGSEMITFDLLTKQYVHIGHVPDFGSSQHLNAHALISDKAPSRTKSHMLFRPKTYNSFSNYDDVTNTKIIQRRKSLLAQAEGYNINITVFGRTDYSVGQRVYLDVPINTQIKAKDTDWQDKLMSGNYLIGALVHFITAESHKCTMQLIKDSFIIDVTATGKQ